MQYVDTGKGRAVDAATSTQVIETTAGAIEYADSGGDGPAVLFVHGSPGGSDQGELMGRFLVAAGLRVVAPSRPGYLGTPLTGDRCTPADQARLQAALMQQLGLDHYGVACWSGGGPSSYQLAIDHPDRVGAIVAFAAVSQPYTFEHPSQESALFARPGAWLLRQLAHHAPHTTVKMLVTEEGDLSTADAKELVARIWDDEGTRQWVLDWAATVSGARAAGFGNDRRCFPGIELDLGAVQAPVLLVHADTDSDVPHAHSEHADALLARSELLTIHDGTHISAWTGPDHQVVQERAIELLRG
jgi:pimeloyl-ACP methyl ester carboxylesterase